MINSVRWPEEMALWTIYTAAETEAPAGFWGQLTDTPAEEMQKKYVRSKLQNKPLVSNEGGIDFLILVGKTMSKFFTGLKREPLTEEEAQSSLKKAICDLSRIEQRVLERSSFSRKELKLASQMETAHKAILVFQRMQEKLPLFFQKGCDYAMRVHQSRQLITELEHKFSKEVSILYQHLDLLQKELEKTQLKDEKVMSRYTNEGVVCLVKKEVAHFRDYFSKKSLREISPRFHYEEIVRGFECANKDLEKFTLRTLPGNPKSSELVAARKAIVTIRKIVDLIEYYRVRRDNQEKIKQKYKEKFSQLPEKMEKEFFHEISQIQVSNQEDDEEDLMFVMDNSPLHKGLGILDLSLCEPSSCCPSSPKGIGIDISPVCHAEIQDIDSSNSECKSDSVLAVLGEESREVYFEPECSKLKRDPFKKESILQQWIQKGVTNEWEKACSDGKFRTL